MALDIVPSRSQGEVAVPVVVVSSLGLPQPLYQLFFTVPRLAYLQNWAVEFAANKVKNTRFHERAVGVKWWIYKKALLFNIHNNNKKGSIGEGLITFLTMY